MLVGATIKLRIPVLYTQSSRFCLFVCLFVFCLFGYLFQLDPIYKEKKKKVKAPIARILARRNANTLNHGRTTEKGTECCVTEDLFRRSQYGMCQTLNGGANFEWH